MVGVVADCANQSFYIAFSENVTGLTSGGFTVTNGTAGTLSGNNSYTGQTSIYGGAIIVTGSLSPQNPVDDPSVVDVGPTPLRPLGREQRLQPLPLLVGQLSSVSHADC